MRVEVRSKDWRGALSLALGLTLAAKGDEFWYCDTDGPEHVAAIWKKLRASWTTILKQPDDVIGLDTPGRASVASLLKDFRHDLKQYGCL
ncbi:hypothetical protein MNEG_6642 [Monoraphidium neglectum]|uniref:Uncharacterized protein n=1 Tax=Monoraphidium neglectum TaxID=145388 RepID=A0A0D2ML81_9CHLO|nr:hypothetical protein MNEG_6642 [Monoraphidium neglectum]KIZ01322.1 hypothetical protein MNEG_6642 [Monoraphidium neglectum]|eukprot:XP_013900341.1 hypothetical protein MNEG_6642 [Monoraphidium neglectum]